MVLLGCKTLLMRAYNMACLLYTSYIVSGRYRFTIGDETREVGPGDTLLKQNGVMHGLSLIHI